MQRWNPAIPIAVVSAAAWFACGGGGSKQKVYDPPVIAIHPSDRQVQVPGGLAAGDVWKYPVDITNVVKGSLLKVTGVRLDETACGEGAAFSLDVESGVPFPIELAGTGDGAATGKPESLRVTVSYTAPAAVCERTAVLHIQSDTRDAELRDLTITFDVSIPTPHLVVSPAVVDLGIVEEGQAAEAELSLRNTGLAELVVNRLRFKQTVGTGGFAFQWGCYRKDAPAEFQQRWLTVTPKEQSFDSSECDRPLTIAPNTEYPVRVRYGAVGVDPAKAEVVFVSNDPAYDAASGEGARVEFWANVSGPCLRANPTAVDFGTVIKGSFHAESVELFSCGDQRVEVSKVVLAQGDQSPFHLDLSGLGTFSESQPLVLNPGDRKTFLITYLPQTVKTDAGGKVLGDSDTVQVANTSTRPEITIPVSGIAMEGQKPVCDFKVTSTKDNQKEVPDDGSVLVLDRLNFYDQSFDPMPGGGIVAWEWSVTAPPGSADVFQPSYTFPTPTFEVNVVGDYLFGLKVFNKLGIASDTCTKLVHVKAGEGCVVELTWETPLDPDPTDQCGTGKDCGSDMDLHVVHPYASSPDVDKDGKPDGFFDKRWDCFWFNPRPIWVEGGDPVLDQPRLDRDDTDGAGPENFHYDVAEMGRCYKVGVHYWDDHGFGASLPTLKVFIDGDLRYEKKAPKMKMQDMWEAGEVCCRNPDKPFIEYEVAGAPVIIKNYVNPEFNFNP